MALPTRRCVAPAATAASRSPLMPAETQVASGWSRRTRVRRPRPAGRTPRAGRRPAGPPPSPRAAPGRPRGDRGRPARQPASRSSARHAPARRVTVQADLQQHVRAIAPAGRSTRRPTSPRPGTAGRPSARRRRTTRPSEPCWTAAVRRSASAGRGRRSSAAFGAASWSRLSPTSRTPSAGQQPDVRRPGRSWSPRPACTSPGPARPRRRRPRPGLTPVQAAASSARRAGRPAVGSGWSLG